MALETSIVERLKNARCTSDLAMVFEVWGSGVTGAKLARSSDQVVIRKSAAALARLGEAISDRLVPEKSASFRCLPEVGPAIRVRSTPSRFWLEIDPADAAGEWPDRPVLFVELSQTTVRYGVRLSTDRTALCRQTIKTLREAAAGPQVASDGWKLEQRRAPAEQNECSTDVNAWLGMRTKAIQADPVHAVLCRSVDAQMSFADLLTGLGEAAEILATLPAPEVGQAETAGCNVYQFHHAHA